LQHIWSHRNLSVTMRLCNSACTGEEKPVGYSHIKPNFSAWILRSVGNAELLKGKIGRRCYFERREIYIHFLFNSANEAWGSLCEV